MKGPFLGLVAVIILVLAANLAAASENEKCLVGYASAAPSAIVVPFRPRPPAPREPVSVPKAAGPKQNQLPNDLLQAMTDLRVVMRAQSNAKWLVSHQGYDAGALLDVTGMVLDSIERWIAEVRPYLRAKTRFDMDPVFETAASVFEVYLQPDEYMRVVERLARSGRTHQMRGNAREYLERLERMRIAIIFIQGSALLRIVE